jgi:short-subunit dehydrogenase
MALVGYLESLRPALRRRGVRVTLAYPGFVQTRLLDDLVREGMKPPPTVVDADTTARKILHAAGRGYRVVSFPWHIAWLMTLARLAPSFLYDWFMPLVASQVRLPY